MAHRQALTTAVLVAAVASFIQPAHAASVARIDQIMAAGACQPFVPTTQVRYNASGIHNVGTSLIYVVCSTTGASQLLASTNIFELGASNGSGVAQTVSCTARPGIASLTFDSQAAFARSMAVAPGSFHLFTWDDSDFAGADVASNLNFTCALGPGVSLDYIRMRYSEDVGL